MVLNAMPYFLGYNVMRNCIILLMFFLCSCGSIENETEKISISPKNNDTSNNDLKNDNVSLLKLSPTFDEKNVKKDVNIIAVLSNYQNISIVKENLTVADFLGSPIDFGFEFEDGVITINPKNDLQYGCYYTVKFDNIFKDKEFWTFFSVEKDSEKSNIWE